MKEQARSGLRRLCRMTGLSRRHQASEPEVLGTLRVAGGCQVR